MPWTEREIQAEILRRHVNGPTGINVRDRKRMESINWREDITLKEMKACLTPACVNKGRYKGSLPFRSENELSKVNISEIVGICSSG